METRERPALLVGGRIVGEGEDGEPVLRRSTIATMRRLGPMDIWAQGQINLWPGGDENEVPPGISREERRQFDEAIKAEMRRLWKD